MIREPSGVRELDRIVNISDGVFAIVITLLILDIRVPEIPEAQVAAELADRLLALGPKFFSYAVSFVVIAIYWTVHHRVFRPIRSYDGGLLWLNFAFLMSITFLPFPTSLLGEYGDQQLSVVVYALNAAVSSLLLAGISWYATRRDLVDPGSNHAESRRHLLRSLAVPAIFLLSIGISFFTVSGAMYSWTLLFVVQSVLRRLFP